MSPFISTQREYGTVFFQLGDFRRRRLPVFTGKYSKRVLQEHQYGPRRYETTFLSLESNSLPRFTIRYFAGDLVVHWV